MSATWLVNFASKSVERDWVRLAKREPEAMARCRAYLESTPNTRRPGRIFPLRGHRNKGDWQFEVTGGDRVRYHIDLEHRAVIIKYAGAHPGGD